MLQTPRAKLFWNFLVCTIFWSWTSPALASAISGTIDSTYKYAWGDEMGWINFGATNGNVTITDSALSGYAWSDTLGWINLSPSQSGVTNNSEGDLSGYAWNESAGWINFANIFIGDDGAFSGTATTDTSGTLTFNCSNCSVRTDWRPASTRSMGSGSVELRHINNVILLPTGEYRINGNGLDQTISQIQLVSNTVPASTFIVSTFSTVSQYQINFTLPNNLPFGNYFVKITFSGPFVITSPSAITIGTAPVVPPTDIIPIIPPTETTSPPLPSTSDPTISKPEFFYRPFEYQWVSQNGVVQNQAHTLYVKAGAVVDLNLVIRNRAKDPRATVIYGKKDLAQESPPYRGAHELRIGTVRPQDGQYSWISSDSFMSNPDGGTNRFTVYDGDPVHIGGLIEFNWQIKLISDIQVGEYDLYVGVVREFDAWATQIDRLGRRLPQEDIFWRIIVLP